MISIDFVTGIAIGYALGIVCLFVYLWISEYDS